jgi:hypothetical protein
MNYFADLTACSTCFGHHYAHHQELGEYYTSGCFLSYLVLGFQVVGMVWCWGLCVRFAGCCNPQTEHTTLSSTPYRQLEDQAPNTTGSNHLYNTLELLMMGIMVPETCWASSKICKKIHLLQLVGILFPHIIDDARSKPHQICYVLFCGVYDIFCKLIVLHLDYQCWHLLHFIEE